MLADLGRGSRARAVHQLLRFVLGGALNTGVTLALFSYLAGQLPYLTAYLVVYAVGILLGYVINSRFVFQVRPSWRTFSRYPGVYVLQGVTGAALMWVAVDGLGLPHLAALVGTIAVTVPLGFALQRLVLLRPGADELISQPNTWNHTYCERSTTQSAGLG